MSDLMYVTEAVPAICHPPVRPGDIILGPSDQKLVAKGQSTNADGWRVKTFNSRSEASGYGVFYSREIDDQVAHQFFLKRTGESLDGQQILTKLFGAIDVPHAGFSVASVRNVMGLKVYNGRGGYGTVVAQSTIVHNPWVLLRGPSTLARTVPSQMTGWHTKRGVSLLSAYLGVRRLKGLHPGVVLRWKDQHLVVEKVENEHVGLLSIEQSKALRLPMDTVAQLFVLGSTRRVGDFLKGMPKALPAPTLMLESGTAAPIAAPTLTDKVDDAIATTQISAPVGAYDLLESVRVQAVYLLDHLDLLPAGEREEAAALLSDHLITALQLHAQAIEHSVSDQAKAGADEKLIKQLTLVESSVGTYRSQIESEVARQQDEHGRFLDAKLRRSDLDS